MLTDHQVAAPPAGVLLAAPAAAPVAAKIAVSGMDFYYGKNRVLEQVTMGVMPNQVTALIGPSGCG